MNENIQNDNLNPKETTVYLYLPNATYDDIIDAIFQFVGSDMLIALKISDFILQTAIAALEKPLDNSDNLVADNQ